uniref:Uncharacterized protein n=1 Tax=Lotharella globosa TaxID=91324 RepID=A0A7S3YHY6_9EUKA
MDIDMFLVHGSKFRIFSLVFTFISDIHSCGWFIRSLRSHMAPYDVFCKNTLPLCGELMGECLGFKGQCAGSGKESKCCQCAYSECPLEEAGCAMITRKCFPETIASDVEVYFSSYDAIDRADQEALKSGKKGYRVNRNPSKARTISFDPNAHRLPAHGSMSCSGHKIVLTLKHSEIFRNRDSERLTGCPSCETAEPVAEGSTNSKKRKSKSNLENILGSPNLTDPESSESNSVMDLPKRIGMEGIAAMVEAFEDFVSISRSRR